MGYMCHGLLPRLCVLCSPLGYVYHGFVNGVCLHGVFVP
jgi:hypothetical protein